MKKKLNALTRAVEMMDVKGLKEQLSKTRSRESSVDDPSKEPSVDTPRKSDNRMTIKVDLMQREIHSNQEQANHKIAEHNARLDELDRKVEFLESVIQSMKKRMTEIHNLGKKN